MEVRLTERTAEGKIGLRLWQYNNKGQYFSIKKASEAKNQIIII